jgi:predicted transcriptional regulator
MDREKLKTYLEELKDEIEKLEEKDSQAAGRLTELTDNIEKNLASPEDDEPYDDLIEGIQNNVEQFEVDHPTITGVLNRISTLLSNMGI